MAAEKSQIASTGKQNKTKQSSQSWKIPWDPAKTACCKPILIPTETENQNAVVWSPAKQAPAAGKQVTQDPSWGNASPCCYDNVSICSLCLGEIGRGFQRTLQSTDPHKVWRVWWWEYQRPKRSWTLQDTGTLEHTWQHTELRAFHMGLWGFSILSLLFWLIYLKVGCIGFPL